MPTVRALNLPRSFPPGLFEVPFRIVGFLDDFCAFCADCGRIRLIPENRFLSCSFLLFLLLIAGSGSSPVEFSSCRPFLRCLQLALFPYRFSASFPMYCFTPFNRREYPFIFSCILLLSLKRGEFCLFFLFPPSPLSQAGRSSRIFPPPGIRHFFPAQVPPPPSSPASKRWLVLVMALPPLFPPDPKFDPSRGLFPGGLFTWDPFFSSSQA